MSRAVIKYGLRAKGNENILKYFMTTANSESEFCVSIQYELGEIGDGEWLVDTEDKALYVMYNPSKYYNADYDSPQHDYLPEDLEIVKVEQVITETPVEYKIVNITLKEEYVLSGDCIPYFNSDDLFDTFYIANKVGIAIDKGDYFQILKMEYIQSNISTYCKFDKKYFDIIED